MASPESDVPFQDIEAGTPYRGVELPPEPAEAKILKPLPDTTPMERIAACIAAAAVITSLVAIIVEQAAIVIVAGVLSSFVGPYAYFQQTQLTEIKALQETQMVVQQEVNRLKNENNRLEVNISQMEESVQRLQDVKTALDTVTSTQGQSISEFAQQVEANRTNLKMMQTNVKNVVVQNLISILERIDTNRDLQIEAHEVEEALHQLRKLHGVKVDAQKFRQAFSGKTTKSLLNVVGNITRQDLPENERIFEFAQ